MTTLSSGKKQVSRVRSVVVYTNFSVQCLTNVIGVRKMLEKWLQVDILDYISIDPV